MTVTAAQRQKQFLEKWLAELEPDKEKRAAALQACLADLRQLQAKHTALVLSLACIMREES